MNGRIRAIAMFRGAVLAAVALALALLSLGGANVLAATLDRAVRDAVFPATVQVGVMLENGSGERTWITMGSGSVITADGLVLTNHHVIEETDLSASLRDLEAEGFVRVPGQFTIATSDGRNPPEVRFLAELAADDAALDLAVLRIVQDGQGRPVDPASLNLPHFALGSARDIDIGDPLHILGFPVIGEGSLVYTEGILSSFQYEEGIDGPAWITTDAVMSGGNSGGAAVDDAGALIGVPTRGSPLDCRPGDVNGDGVEDANDVGCVPTGGSLGQLRPVDLALPLLRSVSPDIAPAAPDPGAVAVATAGAAASQPVIDVAVADACASRGDWRCASRIYRAALDASPGDPDLTARLHDALVGLGAIEEDARQLGAARDAYLAASDLDPSRADSAAAYARLAPYSGIVSTDGFTEQRYTVFDEPERASAYGDGTLDLTVRTPGWITTYPLPEAALPDAPAAVALDVAGTSGQGAALIGLAGAGGEWLFAADPSTARWSVLQKDASGQFIDWVQPTDYSAVAGPGLSRLEVRIVAGQPSFWINGVDVGAALGIALPAVGSGGSASFGASMAFEGAEPFTVSLDRASVYLLG